MSFNFEVTKEHRAYLSRILTGTDDDAVFAAVERACNEWGLFPDVDEPTDAQYSDSEAVATKIADVIRTGLEDGSIKAKGKASGTAAKPANEDEESDAEVLAAFGF